MPRPDCVLKPLAFLTDVDQCRAIIDPIEGIGDGQFANSRLCVINNRKKLV